jgi:hypothetical protein
LGWWRHSGTLVLRYPRALGEFGNFEMSAWINYVVGATSEHYPALAHRA